MSELPRTVFLDRTSPPHILTLVLLASIAALSMTVFLPSLPVMAEDFDADYGVMQLSVSAFLFVNGSLHVVIGPISDRFGRRPVVIWALALFLVATAGCILSPTVEMFLAFRMAQAVVVAGIVLSRAIVRDMVPQSEAASMIGYVTMGMALVPMIAPMIGGFIGETLGWRASFIFLFLFGAVILLTVCLDQGETNLQRTSSFRQQIGEYPELFRSRRFWGFCVVSCASSGLFFGYLGGAPIIGTIHFGLSPSLLGFYFGIAAFGYFIGNFISGKCSARFGVNRMVLSGSLLLLTSPLAALAALQAGVTHPVGFFGFMVIMGISNGIILPNATAGMLSVRPRLAGTASGIGGAITIGGGSGIAALAGLLLGQDASPMPLVLIMIACSGVSLIATLYVLAVDRQVRRRAGDSKQTS